MYASKRVRQRERKKRKTKQKVKQRQWHCTVGGGGGIGTGISNSFVIRCHQHWTCKWFEIHNKLDVCCCYFFLPLCTVFFLLVYAGNMVICIRMCCLHLCVWSQSFYLVCWNIKYVKYKGALQKIERARGKRSDDDDVDNKPTSGITSNNTRTLRQAQTNPKQETCKHIHTHTHTKENHQTQTLTHAAFVCRIHFHPDEHEKRAPHRTGKIEQKHHTKYVRHKAKWCLLAPVERLICFVSLMSPIRTEWNGLCIHVPPLLICVVSLFILRCFFIQVDRSF